MFKTYKNIFIGISVSTIFSIAATLFFSQIAHASLKINEFACFTTDDWIEIFNTGTENIDLSLYELLDSTDSNKKDLEGFIEPAGFVVVEWNKLNKDADSVILRLKETGIVEDSISYGDDGAVIAPVSENQTIGRIPDGGEKVEIFTSASKGSSNSSGHIFQTPTPTPTVTPTLSKTPTPTKTPSPSKTPKPTPAITSEVLSVSDSTAQIRTSLSRDSQVKKVSSMGAVPTAVLGDSEYVSDEENEEVIEVASEQVNIKKPASLIASGLIFMTACGILFYRKFKKAV